MTLIESLRLAYASERVNLAHMVHLFIMESDATEFLEQVFNRFSLGHPFAGFFFTIRLLLRPLDGFFCPVQRNYDHAHQVRDDEISRIDHYATALNGYID